MSALLEQTPSNDQIPAATMPLLPRLERWQAFFSRPAWQDLLLYFAAEDIHPVAGEGPVHLT
jgi:hypothetical protein